MAEVIGQKTVKTRKDHVCFWLWTKLSQRKFDGTQLRS